MLPSERASAVLPLPMAKRWVARCPTCFTRLAEEPNGGAAWPWQLHGSPDPLKADVRRCACGTRVNLGQAEMWREDRPL